jgi:hypothetical protein
MLSSSPSCSRQISSDYHQASDDKFEREKIKMKYIKHNSGAPKQF